MSQDGLMIELDKSISGLEGGEVLRSIAEEFPGSLERCLALAKSWGAQVANASAAASVKGKAEESKTELEKGKGWCTVPGQSFQVPRGTFDVEFVGADMMYLHGKAKSFTVDLKNVRQIAFLPTENQAMEQMMWSLKEPMPFGECLLLTPKPLPKSKMLKVTIRGCEKEELPSELWKTVLQSLKSIIPVDQASTETYKSASGKAFVKCYHGVNDGKLYFLRSGVAFGPRPAVFLPREDIYVELERMSGGGARNFDINFSLKDGQTVEFRMLQSDEFDGFVNYVEKMKLQKPKVKSEPGANATKNEDEEESGSENDSSFDENEDENEDGESSASSSDRDSDVDVDDCDFSKEIEDDPSSSIANSVRMKRRGNATTILSSSSSSAPSKTDTLAVKEEVDEDEGSALLPTQSFDDGGEDEEEHRSKRSRVG